MEDNDKNKFVFTGFKELKEVEKLYAKCFEAKVDNYIFKGIPSLKYALYNILLFKVFEYRINIIINDIKVLKKKLNDYQGSKLNAKEEIEKLDESILNLPSIKKEADERQIFYRHYLIDLAKKSDRLNNEAVKKIFVKGSEEIIQTQINYYMKYEKNFLNIFDNINKLNNVFNI